MKGVQFDIQSYMFVASFQGSKSETIEEIGLFPSEETAALARDMHILNKLGIQGSKKLLNYDYELMSCGTKVRHPSGIEITISDSKANESSKSLGVITNNPALVSVPATSVNYAPKRADVNRKWQDRVLSSFTPTASFTFEITFPKEYASLGLQLRPHLLPFSVTSSHRALACCIVIDTTACPCTLVQPGDILLSVNGQSVLTLEDSCEASYRFDESVRTISQAVAPRTIRFLRSAALCPNLRVSAAEVLLLAGDGHCPIAKYTLGPPNAMGGSSYLSNTYLDNQTPDTIKKMLAGQKVVWEHLVSTAPNPPSGSGGGSRSTAYSAGQQAPQPLNSSFNVDSPVLVTVPCTIPNPAITTSSSSSSSATTTSDANATTTTTAVSMDGQPIPTIPPGTTGATGGSAGAPVLALVPLGTAEKRARVEERAAQIEACLTAR